MLHFLTTNSITIKGLEGKGSDKMVPGNSILSGCKNNTVILGISLSLALSHN